MTNNLKLIMSTFTMQRHGNDCGLACLQSIFKYAGIKYVNHNADNLSNASLLDLHKLSEGAGLPSRCVRMDLEVLQQNQSPCILHVLNDKGHPHFIVHYNCDIENRMHLIGDPDRKLELSTEAELLKRWQSRAALYFENIKPGNNWSHRLFPWNSFAGFKFIPKILWWSVPILNIVAALLGLAVSIIAQKAVEPGFLNCKHAFFVVLLILVVLISAAKCSINYLKQWMMINLGSKIDFKLSYMFLNNLYKTFKSSAYVRNRYLKTIGEVQKIHQAVALLIGVVFSDGLLVMIMLGCLYFYQPALILFEITVFAAMFLIIDRYLPLLLIYYDTGQLAVINSISHEDVEKQIEYESFAENYFKINESFSKTARLFSVISNKINLLFEGITTVNIVIVLFFAIYKLQAQLISYENFLMTIILCYGMSLLMAKICNQLLAITQGAQMLKHSQTSKEIPTA